MRPPLSLTPQALNTESGAQPKPRKSKKGADAEPDAPPATAAKKGAAKAAATPTTAKKTPKSAGKKCENGRLAALAAVAGADDAGMEVDDDGPAADSPHQQV